MEIRQAAIPLACTRTAEIDACAALTPDLVLVFGSIDHFRVSGFSRMLREAFPSSQIVGCSTAGEIANDGVAEGTASVTAVRFKNPNFRVATADIEGLGDSFGVGARIAEKLLGKDLKNILVFAQGVNINGSALIEGIHSLTGDSVTLSGGLAGDGGAFKETFVISNDGVSNRQVVAIGFYGDGVRFGHGSFGGWRPFGPKRKVTRASGNILYELDGAPALEVYKRYLGDYAKDLPASGLLFPFSMLANDATDVGLIRTILGIDEAEGSLFLAGDIIQDGFLQLMQASTDALVDGAHSAAEAARALLQQDAPALAILVSCVGRKLVMGARVDEEVEAVREVFSLGSVITGFYSHGEISPLLSAPECKLHNQTMTVTCLLETA